MSITTFRACSSPMSCEIAVGVSSGAVGFHAGLAYRDKSGERILHLAFHHDLCDEKLSAPSPWTLVTPAVDDMEQQLLASYCVLVAKNLTRNSIPYAFRFAASYIDQQGRYQPGNGELGLTCATFVVAIFEAARVPLLDRPTWNNRSEARIQEDNEAQEQLVQYLRNKAAPSHVSAVSKEVGCVRFRAEEVAVASAIANRPVSFEDVEPEAKQLQLSPPATT